MSAESSVEPSLAVSIAIELSQEPKRLWVGGLKLRKALLSWSGGVADLNRSGGAYLNKIDNSFPRVATRIEPPEAKKPLGVSHKRRWDLELIREGCEALPNIISCEIRHVERGRIRFV